MRTKIVNLCMDDTEIKEETGLKMHRVYEYDGRILLI